MPNLYQVDMSDYGGTFYVVADDPGCAAGLAEQQWCKWNYKSSGSRASSIRLVAEGQRYPTVRGAPWLLAGTLL